MKQYLGWLEGDSVRLWGIVAIASAIGLLGAYGRERNAGRPPDREWLINRLLVMPLLALLAGAGCSTLGMTLEVSLRGMGHQICWCRTLQAAKDALVAQPPDLILLDLGLPDGHGLELCRELRA